MRAKPAEEPEDVDDIEVRSFAEPKECRNRRKLWREDLSYSKHRRDNGSSEEIVPKTPGVLALAVGTYVRASCGPPYMIFSVVFLSLSTSASTDTVNTSVTRLRRYRSIPGGPEGLLKPRLLVAVISAGGPGGPLRLP